MTRFRCAESGCPSLTFVLHFVNKLCPSRCQFGSLGALLQLMQVNRPYTQAFVGELFIDGILRKMPRAMDVVRAEVEHYPPGIVGPSLDAISSQVGTGLVFHEQPKTAKRDRF